MNSHFPIRSSKLLDLVTNRRNNLETAPSSNHKRARQRFSHFSYRIIKVWDDLQSGVIFAPKQHLPSCFEMASHIASPEELLFNFLLFFPVSSFYPNVHSNWKLAPVAVIIVDNWVHQVCCNEFLQKKKRASKGWAGNQRKQFIIVNLQRNGKCITPGTGANITNISE